MGAVLLSGAAAACGQRLAATLGKGPRERTLTAGVAARAQSGLPRAKSTRSAQESPGASAGGRGAKRSHCMRYFVTGATGFIGKRLVQALLARRGSVVHFLLRPESEGKLAGLLDYWGEDSRPRAGGAGLRRPDGEKAWRFRRRHQKAQGPRRPLLPPGGGLRPLGRRRVADRRQHRRHARGRRVRRGDRRRPLAPRQLDRRRRLVRRRVSRGHVRRGRGPRSSVLHDQAREREDRAQASRSCRGRSIARRSSSAIRRPARSTRSTAPTTSSS